MNRLTDLKVLFRVIAVVEFCYAMIGLAPPSMVPALTGWTLGTDGQWLAKLFAVALASQAWVAWTLRNSPHLAVAQALAFYQLASATVDWFMWITLADQNVFSTLQAKIGVAISIPTHYALGLLLVLAIRSERTSSAPGHVQARST